MEEHVRCEPRRRTQVNRRGRVEKDQDDIGTRVAKLPWEEPKGSLQTTWAVSGIQAA